MYKINTYDAFSDILVKLCSSVQYNYIYVSLGSKINEARVNFRYPSNDLNLKSNAEFQMIPKFIRQQPVSNKILSIIIDDFHDVELSYQHDATIHNITKTYKNITVITVDHLITQKSIVKYLTEILNCIFYYKINPTRFMITNFICFKQPIDTQLQFENELPVCIQTIMDTVHNGYYDICFYQWYNYTYYTYNYIYCYKKFSFQRLLSIQQINGIFKQILKYDYLNNANSESITKYVNTSHKNTKKKWELFLDNSIDFVES